MKLWSALALLATGCTLGCMAAGPPLTAENAAPETAPASSPRVVTVPLLIDRSDLRLGTTVQFGHMPDVHEVNDLSIEPGLAHVVVSLDGWPEDLVQMVALEQVPPEADVIVIVRGYPNSPATVDTWKLINARIRLIVHVSGPPNNGLVLDWLNRSPVLERVIAEMAQPSRAGFERLQRPLSFRKVIG